MLPINAAKAAASFKEALKLISARRYDAARDILTGLLRSLPTRPKSPSNLPASPACKDTRPRPPTGWPRREAATEGTRDPEGAA